MATPSGKPSASPTANVKGNKRRGKKRIRSFTADERACHSAIEKQRREALNASFIDLARLVPALAPVHRLSKSLIVQESIQYLQAQREMCLAAANEIKALIAENVELVVEVNSWRKGYGIPGTNSRQVAPVSEAIQKVLEFDKQVYGKFPAGFGDNGPGEGHDVKEPEDASRPQMDGRTVSTQSIYSLQETITSSNLQRDAPVCPFLDSQSSHTESNDLVEVGAMPDNFIEVGQIPTLPLQLDDDIQSSLEAGYGVSLASNINVPTSNHFADLNLYPQDLLHEFNIPLPDVGYNLPPGIDDSNCGYIT